MNLGRPKKHASDAARKAAYEKRQKRKRDAALATAAAAAAPKNEPAILRHLLWLRDEITLFLEKLGLASQGQRGSRRKRLFPPDPSTPGYGSLGERLITLLAFIDKELDKTGVLADRGLRSSDPPRGLIPRLENLRDEITRGRALAGLQRGLTRYNMHGGSAYDVLLDKLTELLNVILKELDQAESWPIKA